MLEGGVERSVRKTVVLAIARQSNQLVLEHLWPDEGSWNVRKRALAEAVRLLEIAGEPRSP